MRKLEIAPHRARLPKKVKERKDTDDKAKKKKQQPDSYQCLLLPVLTVIYPLVPYLGHFLVPGGGRHVHPQAIKAAVHVLDAAALPGITPRHRQRNRRRNGVAKRRVEDHSASGHRSLGRRAPRTGTPCLRAQRVHASTCLSLFLLQTTNHCPLCNAKHLNM